MATRAFLLLVCSCFAACGWAYTNTVEPYCLDMKGTRASGEGQRSSLKSFSIPRIPGARAIWSSNAIGEIARENGMERVHYCDRRRFSVAGGIWYTDEVVVYGE